MSTRAYNQCRHSALLQSNEKNIASPLIGQTHANCRLNWKVCIICANCRSFDTFPYASIVEITLIGNTFFRKQPRHSSGLSHENDRYGIYDHANKPQISSLYAMTLVLDIFVISFISFVLLTIRAAVNFYYTLYVYLIIPLYQHGTKMWGSVTNIVL